MLAALKRYVIEAKGHDAWVDLLEVQTAHARIERAKAHEKQRTSPDYDGMIPDNVRHIAEASRS